MKRLIIICLLLQAYIGNAQIMFDKTYNKVIGIKSIVSDSSYVVMGVGFTPQRMSTFQRISLDGNTILDSNQIQINGYHLYLLDAIKTKDISFAQVGCRVNYSSDTSVARITKLTKQGNSIWAKEYQLGIFDVFNSIQQTPDGGFIAVGYSDPGPGGYDYYIVKTDSLGNEQWHSTGSTMHRAESIELMPDGGYLVAGFNYNGANLYAVMMKIDSAGNIEWNNSYNVNNSIYSYWFNGAKLLSDGNYICYGNRSLNSNPSDGQGFILKFDSNRNIVWTKMYGLPNNWNVFVDLEILSDGSYIICGEGQDLSQTNKVRGSLYKICPDGTQQWGHYYGAPNFPSHFYDISLTTDGGFIATGSTLGSTGTQDIWVVKMDSLGRKDSSQSIPVHYACVPIPERISPPDSAINVPVAATFLWHNVANADSFYLQVSTHGNLDFAMYRVIDTVISDTSFYSDSILQPNTRYYWRIQSKNTDGVSPYSTRWTFKTGNYVGESEAWQQGNSITVYPNPFTEHFEVHLPQNTAESAVIKLYNVLGKEEKAVDVEFISNRKLRLNASELERGMYLLEVQGVGRVKVMKE